MEEKQGFIANLLDCEIVLLKIGIIFYFVTIGAFIYLLKKARLKTSYGAFIFPPLLFIGFPAIRTESP